VYPWLEDFLEACERDLVCPFNDLVGSAKCRAAAGGGLRTATIEYHRAR
jgi:hypothetical protein